MKPGEDLAQGAWFYDRQSPGLGDYFIDCLHSDLRKLSGISGIHEMAFGVSSNAVHEISIRILLPRA